MQSSNGKLATRLDASLADYRKKLADRRDRKAIEERIARAERKAQGIEDDDDDYEKAEWESDDDDTGTIYPEDIPAETDWDNFLQWAGWLDERILVRQPTDWVHRRWRIYSYQLETGLLNPKLF